MIILASYQQYVVSTEILCPSQASFRLFCLILLWFVSSTLSISRVATCVTLEQKTQTSMYDIAECGIHNVFWLTLSLPSIIPFEIVPKINDRQLLHPKHVIPMTNKIFQGSVLSQLLLQICTCKVLKLR